MKEGATDIEFKMKRKVQLATLLWLLTARQKRRNYVLG